MLTDHAARSLQTKMTLRPLLRLLAAIYERIVRARNLAYERGWKRVERVSLPVVSVGNISAGGNGKTPLCLYLAGQLREKQMRPVILSRGYGGSERGPRLVEASDSPDRVGDEPALMARAGVAPVVIARDRLAGARMIESRGLGDLIILDDGFQHRRLHRQIDIVCISVGSGPERFAFEDGRLLPAGRLREPRDEALRRADMIMLVERRQPERNQEATEELMKLLPAGKNVFRAAFLPDSVKSLSGGDKLAPAKVVAFCGIAGPEGFFATLEELGFELAGRLAYPDHHRFTRSDLSGMRDRFDGLPLVCTRKDAVKLEGRTLDGLPEVYALDVEMRVYPPDAFITSVQKDLIQGG